MHEGAGEEGRADPVSVRARAGWDVTLLKAELEAQPGSADLVLKAFDERGRRLTRLNEQTAAVDEALARRAPPPTAPTKQDLNDLERFESAWAAWSRQHRPYGLVAEQAREAWVHMDRAGELDEVVRRLDRLDPAFAIDVHRLEGLLRSPADYADLHRALLDVEADQEKQRSAMQVTVDRLIAEGLPVPPLSSATLLDGYDALEAWTRLSDDLQRIRLRVDRDVRPFDGSIAERLMGRVKEVTTSGDQTATAELEAEVGRIVDGFQRRLDRLNASLDGWRKEGYRLPLDGRALPQDLLDWEANFEEVERLRARHGVAWRRLNDIASVRPEEAARAMALAGDLEATEAFIDQVDALHASWGQATAQAQTMLEAWELEGFDTEAWHARVRHDPAATLHSLEAHQGLVHRAIDLRRRMDALDLSVEGEEGRTRHDELLRTVDLTESLLDEVDAWTTRLERRTSRHRALILDEWTDLRRRGWTDASSPPPSMNLAEAERRVDAMRTRATSRRSDGGIEGRIQRRVLQELEQWAALGWNVETLQQRVANNPTDVGMAMPGLRQAVSDHRRLRRRLEALPWERDSELGMDVLDRMRRPEALADLAHDLPQLARQLAASPPDPDAPTWRAWRPDTMPTSATEVSPPAVAAEEAALSVDEAVTTAPASVVLPESSAPVEPMETPDPAGEPTNAPEHLDEAMLEHDDAQAGAGEQETSEPLPVHEPARSTAKQPASPTMSEGREDVRPALLDLFSRLGLEAPATMDARSVRRTLGPHVQEQPKDLRLTRLLRLALRLTPDALDGATVAQRELMAELSDMVDPLEAWTTLRLQARHLPNGHGLLEDALALGEALDRIPGPGRRLPLGEDEHDLPSSSETSALRAEVQRLSKAINLPSAGGIR